MRFIVPTLLLLASACTPAAQPAPAAPAASPPKAAPPLARTTPAAPTSTWPLVALDDAAASVRLPCAPHEDFVESPPLRTRVLECEDAVRDAVFAVDVTRYPPDFPARGDPDRLVDLARDAMVRVGARSLAFERRVDVAGAAAARDLEIADGARRIVARVVATNDGAVVQMSVAAREGSSALADAPAFFATLALR